MAKKITWGPAPAPDRQIGSVGKMTMFLLAPDKKLGAEPGECRLFIYFPAGHHPVGRDGVRVASEEAAKEYAEELLASFFRKLTAAMRPPNKTSESKK